MGHEFALPARITSRTPMPIPGSSFLAGQLPLPNVIYGIDMWMGMSLRQQPLYPGQLTAGTAAARAGVQFGGVLKAQTITSGGLVLSELNLVWLDEIG